MQTQEVAQGGIAEDKGNGASAQAVKANTFAMVLIFFIRFLIFVFMGRRSAWAMQAPQSENGPRVGMVLMATLCAAWPGYTNLEAASTSAEGIRAA